MKKILRGIFCLGIIWSFWHCAKKEGTAEGEAATNLPNFGRVVLDEPVLRKQEDSLTMALAEYYQRVWSDGDLWGGLLVAKGDEIVYENYRGFAQEGQTQPIDGNTPLHVASVSKTITAMMVLKLAEAGMLGLDDPLTRFFPKFPYPGITVKMLLNHRSGLPKYEHFIDHIEAKEPVLSQKFIHNSEVLDLLIRYKPEAARNPDTGFMYCNTNYALLALIVEKVTGVDFPEAARQMVFRPLKMNHTYVFQAKDTLRASKSFYSKGPRVYPYDRLDLIYGDKNVYTTPRDLYRFSRAMYTEGFLKEDLMAQVFVPYSNEKAGVNNYGLGFRMKIFEDGRRLTYHNGWWHGSNSVFAHLQDSKVTIVAIGNKYSQRVYSALALSALFEPFPYEMAKFRQVMGDTLPSAEEAGDGSE
ncbi:serine hydrolase domain-containing protein [Bergeyella sp. RCAD1439]|uniref:serine hydrolase domain-containing protein n=1 Tax=Bergeyella anatis TaxID=3113737 RepID=UPI002E18C226|nr:serine hydrolase domain-containing protein [Bergeyella sp. RCAD1439]